MLDPVKVCVLVLVDSSGQLSQTVRALDLQSLPYAEYGVRYLIDDPSGALDRRLGQLSRRRPNVGVLGVSAGDYGAAARAALERSGADFVTVVAGGTRLHEEALERLLALAADSAAPVVAGRASGSGPSGANTSLPAEVSPAVLLVAADLASAAVEATPASPSAAEWTAGWQRSVIEGAETVLLLADYPAVGGPALAEAQLPLVAAGDIGWVGAELHIRSQVSPPADGTVSYYLHEESTGVEYPVATVVHEEAERQVAAGAFDPGTAALGEELPAGDWAVGIDVVSPAGHSRSLLRNRQVTPAVVHGRPVARTLKGRHLSLQVGRIRRNIVTADPAQALIEESVRGVRLTLPLQNLHVADTDVFAGQLVLGRLPVDAEIRAVDGTPQLELWLSGLAGDYPLSARFNSQAPHATGLVLKVDGVGSMTIEAVPRRDAAKPAPRRRTPPPPPKTAMQRLRARVPDPIAKALGRRR